KLTDPPLSGPLVYNAPSGNGPNNLTLRLHTLPLGTFIELLRNGGLVAAQLLASTPSVQITGAATVPNSLTLDNAFRGVIPRSITFNGGSRGRKTVLLPRPDAARPPPPPPP